MEDPLVYHQRHPRGVDREFLIHVESLPQDVEIVTLPTLLMYGTADRLVAPAGSEMISSGSPPRT